MEINENDYLDKEYKADTIYNKDVDKEDLLYLIETHFSDYWDMLDTNELQIYNKDIDREDLKITRDDVSKALTYFKQDLINEIYGIYNYTYFLIDILTNKKNIGKYPNKEAIKRVGIMVLTLRLSRLLDRHTIRQIEKARYKNKGENYQYKVPPEYSKSLLLAYNFFRDGSYIKIKERQKKAVAPKEINSFYDGTMYSQELQYLKDIFLYTNAPEEFLYLTDHYKEHLTVNQIINQSNFLITSYKYYKNNKSLDKSTLIKYHYADFNKKRSTQRQITY